MKYIPFYLLLVFSLISCEDETMSETENENMDFVFGWSYGECGGDCVSLFRLDDDSLYPDDEHGYFPTSGNVDFKDESLADASALIEAQSLLEDFPNYLIESNENRFGCPDCGDWGSIHIMLEIDDEERWWTLDNQIDGNPEEIQGWTQRVQDLIVELTKF